MFKSQKVWNVNSLRQSNNDHSLSNRSETETQTTDQSRFSCSTPPIKFHDSGLRNIFFVHHLMGISYFGASVPSHRLSNFFKALLILWNGAAFAFSYYTFYLSTQQPPPPQPDPNDLRASAENAFIGPKALAPLVNYIRFCSLMVYFCCSYILNLYMACISRPLLKVIKEEILPLLDPETEHRIGTGIALIQTVMIAFLTVIFQILLYSNFKTLQWDRWIENIFNLYSLSSPLTAIAYVNFSLAHVIRTSGEEGDLSLYIQRLMAVGPILCRITYLLSPAILVCIINATIVTIASLCLLVADFHSTFFISIIGFLDYSVLLISLVLVSSYAYESTKETNAKFQTQLYLAVCAADNLSKKHGTASTEPPSSSNQLICSQLTILSQLEGSIQMCPFGLFYLSRAYITTFFSFMLSYSVIMIQTSESSVPLTVAPATSSGGHPNT